MQIAISEFVRRQTAESRFAHFDGSEIELLQLINKNWEFRKDSGAGIAVSVCPEGFWCSTIAIQQDTKFHVEFSPRRENEESHLQIHAKGEKVPAKFVEIILYHRDVLEADNEPLTGADWEVISINGYPDKMATPMHPLTMARNFLDKDGGTKVSYTAKQFAEAIWYWSQHTNVQK